MDKLYCVKCHIFTETKDVKTKTTKNNNQMLQGICVLCGTKKSKFISASVSAKAVCLSLTNRWSEKNYRVGCNFNIM